MNPPDSDTAVPLLELVDAEVVRDGRAILCVEKFLLRQGERVAILGPNGAGKSTLIRLLTRDVLPLWRSEPPVRILGNPRPGLFEVRAALGVVSDALQEEYILPISVRDAVLSGFFGSIGLRQGRTPTEKQRAAAATLCERLGIAEIAERTLDTLSTGEARRTLVARALARDPDALVLDEPCDGLDPLATRDFLEDVVRPLAREGRTIVIVTHHVDDVVPEVDRVVLLREGRIVADGEKAAVLTSENLSDLYGFSARLEERDGWYRLWW